jgi:hypothetical protein
VLAERDPQPVVLSKKQWAVLDAVCRGYIDHGRALTLGELLQCHRNPPAAAPLGALGAGAW